MVVFNISYSILPLIVGTILFAAVIEQFKREAHMI